MNDLDYLEQISRKAKPTKVNGKSGGLFDARVIKIIVGLVGALILVFVIGVIVNQVKGDPTEDLKRLDLRMSNLSTTVDTYNKSVKSSKIRSLGLSLGGSLTDTLRDLEAHLSEDYGFEKKDAGGKLKEEEEEHYKKLDESLLNGKLNGILDQVYMRDMRLELSLVLSLEAQILKDTKDDKVKEILKKSQDGLTTVYEQFVELAGDGLV